MLKDQKEHSWSINPNLHASSVLWCGLCSYVLKAERFHHYFREIKGSQSKMLLLYIGLCISHKVQKDNNRDLLRMWYHQEVLKHFYAVIATIWAYWELDKFQKETEAPVALCNCYWKTKQANKEAKHWERQKSDILCINNRTNTGNKEFHCKYLLRWYHSSISSDFPSVLGCSSLKHLAPFTGNKQEVQVVCMIPAFAAV